MDFSKATDDQLWNIIANDWEIPSQHLEGLVNEALSRNLFEHLIKHLINKMFDRWDPERRYNFYDLFQVGYIGIGFALKNYRVGKGSFKTFAYMNIKSQFAHHKDKLNSEKRKLYEVMDSLDVNRFDETKGTFMDALIDKSQNPERATINKIFWEEQFAKVSEREKEVLLYFAKGYSMNEIAGLYKIKGAASIHRQFHRGVLKINPSAGKVDIKAMGLMTRRNGA